VSERALSVQQPAASATNAMVEWDSTTMYNITPSQSEASLSEPQYVTWAKSASTGFPQSFMSVKLSQNWMKPHVEAPRFSLVETMGDAQRESVL
jgi:hypothetical protein